MKYKSDSSLTCFTLSYPENTGTVLKIMFCLLRVTCFQIHNLTVIIQLSHIIGAIDGVGK
jgi:hypothetical protein